MKKVINEAGNAIDFEAAVNIMDDEIREDLAAEMAPCEDQEFFDAYCKRHAEKFGDEFEPNKANGQW